MDWFRNLAIVGLAALAASPARAITMAEVDKLIEDKICPRPLVPLKDHTYGEVCGSTDGPHSDAFYVEWNRCAGRVQRENDAIYKYNRVVDQCKQAGAYFGNTAQQAPTKSLPAPSPRQGVASESPPAPSRDQRGSKDGTPADTIRVQVCAKVKEAQCVEQAINFGLSGDAKSRFWKACFNSNVYRSIYCEEGRDYREKMLGARSEMAGILKEAHKDATRDDRRNPTEERGSGSANLRPAFHPGENHYCIVSMGGHVYNQCGRAALLMVGGRRVLVPGESDGPSGVTCDPLPGRGCVSYYP